MIRTGQIRGTGVVGADGLLVGRVADTWPLDGGGLPRLALVRVGRRFPRLRYVPLEAAVMESGYLRVPWTQVELDDGPCAEDHRWGDPAQVAMAYWTTADT